MMVFNFVLDAYKTEKLPPVPPSVCIFYKEPVLHCSAIVQHLLTTIYIIHIQSVLDRLCISFCSQKSLVAHKKIVLYNLTKNDRLIALVTDDAQVQSCISPILEKGFDCLGVIHRYAPLMELSDCRLYLPHIVSPPLVGKLFLRDVFF